MTHWFCTTVSEGHVSERSGTHKCLRYGSDCGVDTHALGPQMVRQNLRDVKVGQDCEADVVKAVVDEQLLIRYSVR